MLNVDSTRRGNESSYANIPQVIHGVLYSGKTRIPFIVLEERLLASWFCLIQPQTQVTASREGRYEYHAEELPSLSRFNVIHNTCLSNVGTSEGMNSTQFVVFVPSVQNMQK